MPPRFVADGVKRTKSTYVITKVFSSYQTRGLRPSLPLREQLRGLRKESGLCGTKGGNLQAAPDGWQPFGRVGKRGSFLTGGPVRLAVPAWPALSWLIPGLSGLSRVTTDFPVST